MIDEREIQRITALRNNFPLFAEYNLKIKTKEGKLEPFIFNDPQKHIHKELQNQLDSTGKIRAIILKGRQQGACLSPDMKVIKSDFEWVEIDNIKVGDKVLSVDEEFNGLTSNGRNQTRKMRVAVVEDRREFIKELFEIVLDNGTILKSTNDHRWMSRQRGGDYVIWRHVKDLKVGDVLRAATHQPENIIRTFNDGWIGGVLDADGSCSTTGAPRIGFSQVEGDILDKYKNYLKSHNIRFYETVDNRTKVGKYTKLGDKPVHCVRVDRFPDMVKLISRCNPVRFDKEGMYNGRKLSTTSDGFAAWPKIISIRSLGQSKVIDIQTSTKTFIAEGIVSHNSTYSEGRLYWRVATQSGKQAYILTHEQAATDNIFAMAKRYHDNADIKTKPSTGAANAKELYFDKLDSGYKVGTAGSKAVGRSGTIQYLHGSEMAFWPSADDHFAGVMQCVPEADGTEVIIESTANGVGGKFYELWVSAVNGESDYKPIFVPWFWSPEYVKDARYFKPSQDELKKQEIYGVTLEQLAWRRSKIDEMGNDLCDQEYPYCWQDAFLASGRTVFDKDLMSKALKNCWEPRKRMILENNKFIERKDGELKVWISPSASGRYVLAADVAEGLSHGDYSVAIVRDMEGRQCAEYHGHCAPDIFGKLLNALGHYYNSALIMVENNNHGLTTLVYLRDSARYGNLYVQRAIDDAYSNDVEGSKLGFTTTSKSKPYIIDQLSAELREGTHGIYSKDVIHEMQTFVIDERGRYNSTQGTNDDRVMAYALAGEALRMCPQFNRLSKKHV